MTNRNKQSRAFGTAARHALLTFSLGLMACAVPHRDATAGTMACDSALDHLMSEWNSIGFATPSKPGQMIVSGRTGYSTTGGQVNYMLTQIRIAARDCEAGRNEESLSHIATVRRVLDRIHHI
jgi:hypothetical protein